MKKLIDANVILRYLLGDHPEYSEKARKVIAEGAYTLPEVLAEDEENDAGINGRS